MRTVSILLLTGLCALFVLSSAIAQPFARPNAQNRVDRWNDMWVNFTNYGYMGNDGPGMMTALDDPCSPNPWAPQCEMPGGSSQQYLFQAGLWIGAKVDVGGNYIPRVSTATDGWLNPAIMEFWPGEGPENGINERSRLDTVDCFGQNVHSESASADHELVAVYTDTLSDQQYVSDDPVDGPHRPLGVKVTQISGDMRPSGCSHIYWLHYVIENIGSSTLRDMYVGQYVDGDVGRSDMLNQHVDDLTGFEPTEQIAYIADNDGRDPNQTSGPFVAPHVTGMMFLTPTQSYQRLSYNWWISNGDATLDYGPAWRSYAESDSAGMGWTNTYGTPMGDLRKYQVMSNGEIDFDQLHVNDAEWIGEHPQGPQAWSTASPSPNAPDIANGYDTRYLLSLGPLGSHVGDHTELAPGERIDVWMAYVGGLNFHNPEHPQPSNQVIDPSLFDFTDLLAKASTARGNTCFDWATLGAGNPKVAPSDFALEPLYPNPFNSMSTIRFTLARSSQVDIAVFDILGREVAQLASSQFAAGNHALSWNAAGLSSGLYFIQARVGDVHFTQKAMLLK
ncbi:MAG TPA: T9SS type A sorting domain-containing protein [bacterium]|jgi:hypothetical protein